MKIHKLLDKYFEGQTSLQEEVQLREYFQRADIESELMPYKGLFQYFEREPLPKLSSNFEENLFAQLDVEKPVATIRRLPFYALRIAASIALIVGLFYLIQINPFSSTTPQTALVEKGEITEAEEAFEETKAALLLVAAKLNKGARKATQEMEKMEEVGKYLPTNE